MSSHADTTDGFVERVAYEAMRDKRDALREALERIETSSGSPNVVWIAREALAGDAE